MSFNYLIPPSFNSLIITGLILFYIIIFIFLNFNTIKHLEIYKKIIILLFLSTAIGVHGLIHLGLESVYGFNPYKLM